MPSHAKAMLRHLYNLSDDENSFWHAPLQQLAHAHVMKDGWESEWLAGPEPKIKPAEFGFTVILVWVMAHAKVYGHVAKSDDTLAPGSDNLQAAAAIANLSGRIRTWHPSWHKILDLSPDFADQLDRVAEFCAAFGGDFARIFAALPDVTKLHHQRRGIQPALEVAFTNGMMYALGCFASPPSPVLVARVAQALFDRPDGKPSPNTVLKRWRAANPLGASSQSQADR